MKFFAVLLVLFQTSQAFAFGSTRQVEEEVFVHNNCNAYVNIATDFVSRHWIERLVFRRLNQSGWKKVHFVIGKEEKPIDAIWIVMEVFAVNSHGYNSCGISSRIRGYVYSNHDWDTMAVAEAWAKDSPSTFQTCVDGKEQQDIVWKSVLSIPSCRTYEEVELMKTLNATEKGEEFKK